MAISRCRDVCISHETVTPSDSGSMEMGTYNQEAPVALGNILASFKCVSACVCVHLHMRSASEPAHVCMCILSCYLPKKDFISFKIMCLHVSICM